MIIRQNYLEKIRPFYDTDLVKVITGVRRCGKSVILQQVMDEIRKTSDNILYLNLENSSDFLKASTSKELIQYVEQNRKEGKCYIFLDEIQEIDDWHIAVKDLRLGNTSLFITGSNSKLLSKEILTKLSGRFVSFRIRPFTYQEILAFSQQQNKTCSVIDYLTWGGFPARFNFSSLDATKNYLQDLETTIVYNDLIKRYNIRKIVSFKKIVHFIFKSNARILSARNIHNYLSHECEKISLNTVLKYLEYLKEAYIIDEVEQYSSKTKKELAYYYKVYLADVCFNSLSVINNRFDFDHNMENIVYNELLYRGYQVKVYQNQNKEIDFYATKNGKQYYIQVAYSIVDEKAYKREMEAFKSLDALSSKIIITNDDMDYSTSSIRHISLKAFLLMEDF